MKLTNRLTGFCTLILTVSYSYQNGQHHQFIEHMKIASQIASSDPSSLVIFSGGQTREVAGPRSESFSYWLIAKANNWFGYKVSPRAITEDFAKDSYENLLFSICRFKQFTGLQ